MSQSKSGPIEVILSVEILDEGEPPELWPVEIKGSTESPGDGSLSDVEWATSEIEGVGAREALFPDGCEPGIPPVLPGQRLRVKGHVWGESYNGPDGWDGDGGFEVESVEVFDAPLETAQETLFPLVMERLRALPWVEVGAGEFEKVLDIEEHHWSLEHVCCQDCRTERWPCFMLTDELWESLGLEGYICLECVQDRLDHPLRLEDFNGAPCNEWVEGWIREGEARGGPHHTSTVNAPLYNGFTRLTVSVRNPGFVGDLPPRKEPRPKPVSFAPDAAEDW